MSIGTHRFIIFWPQGTVQHVEMMAMLSPLDYPVGTWLYDKERVLPGCGWIQLVQYTMPRKIAWEMYTLEADELKEVTKMMKMTALVMP